MWELRSPRWSLCTVTGLWDETRLNLVNKYGVSEEPIVCLHLRDIITVSYPKYVERKSQKQWYCLRKCMGSYIRDRNFVEHSRNITGDFKIKQINIQRESESRTSIDTCSGWRLNFNYQMLLKNAVGGRTGRMEGRLSKLAVLGLCRLFASEHWSWSSERER
jgi:hypothetical protein